MRILFILALAVTIAGCQSVQRPGPRPDGSVLLPNHWYLTPTGKQVPVGDLPLAMALSPDGKYLLVTNNGYADQYVSVIDVAKQKEVDRFPMKQSWLGLAFSPDGKTVYVSAGGMDEVEVLEFDDGELEHERTLPVKATGDETPYFVSGLTVSADGRRLYACALRQNKLMSFDLTSPDSLPTLVDVGDWPYTTVLDEPRHRAYVSNWGDRSVSVVDLNQGRETARIPVGDHPNAMALATRRHMLYVVSANDNELTAIDLTTAQVESVTSLAPYDGASPSGTTPNGLALTSDETTLYIANADNNSVSVVDVSDKPRILGAIPTGWYPTAVRVNRDGDTLYIANGKGLGSAPNPGGPQPTDREHSSQYIGELFLGTVGIVPVPDAATLSRMTTQVAKNNGFDTIQSRLEPGSPHVAPRAVPRHLGEPSTIKHVFYIVKENRTYDQILGDLPQGEGDPALSLFGRQVTPNHHALAESFVLFDNFYVDAEVSQDGHSWSMGAYATDFTEKMWPTNYSGRTFPAPIYLTVAFPSTGFLWDAAASAGVSYRSYGEFVRKGMEGSYSPVPALADHVSPTYPSLDLTIRDQARADAFIAELNAMIEAGDVPALNILSLPSDHTLGTRPGAWTPRAMMADNDLALGRIIEAISHSPIWKESVVFVIQDDSQNGPDHIDAHRTVSLIASPWAKRGYVDHTMYDTVSLLRTLELILGLSPMSQYDAAAVPMFDAFTDKPDLTPFGARPDTWSLEERNTKESYG
ncbi:MAG: bifunctional YncE family protein/alkaline phosphatase family protein, partial [Pseudomonadales bacterium]|nr:bifunctional YncE family protein/alkaline phosphatase family protein [Pseudomonadales bacterium]